MTIDERTSDDLCAISIYLVCKSSETETRSQPCTRARNNVKNHVWNRHTLLCGVCGVCGNHRLKKQSTHGGQARTQVPTVGLKAVRIGLHQGPQVALRVQRSASSPAAPIKIALGS